MNEVAQQANPASSDSTKAEITLGKRLQQARLAAGMTQQSLCQKAGLSYSTLTKIERGAIKAPSIFTIQQIATVLNTSLDRLIGQEPAGPKGDTKKQAKSGVRFVFFDVNGCLVRFFQGAFTKLAEDTGASPDLIETTFWHYNDAVCKGEMSLVEFNTVLARKLGVPSIDWQSYYMSAVEPIPEMQEMLAWASQNYHIGLLSNIMPGFVSAMRKSGLIPDVQYTAIVDSSEVGALKPDPAIYEAAQSMAGCLPSEILLVDDSRTNLMAAERRGWHVLWFDDYRPAGSVARIKGALEAA